MIVLPLGFGLLVRSVTGDNVSALGSIMAAYGAGNLASNVVLGNASGRPERLMFAGRIIAGLGFMGCMVPPSPMALMIAAALAASGGPATDIGFLGMLQAHLSEGEVARVYRLNLAVSFGVMVIGYFASPLFFETLGPGVVIGGCGLTIAVAGAIGLWRYGEPRVSPSLGS